jgi:hypothetical protein
MNTSILTPPLPAPPKHLRGKARRKWRIGLAERDPAYRVQYEAWKAALATDNAARSAAIAAQNKAKQEAWDADYKARLASIPYPPLVCGATLKNGKTCQERGHTNGLCSRHGGSGVLPVYLSRAQMRTRGWTPQLIEALLGSLPDKRGAHPQWGSWPLYNERRVLHAEEDARFIKERVV